MWDCACVMRESSTVNHLLVRSLDRTLLLSLYTDAWCEYIQPMDVTFVVLIPSLSSSAKSATIRIREQKNDRQKIALIAANRSPAMALPARQ
jgi:hypothetical protein